MAAGWHARMNVGGLRSRDPDHSSLLERTLCQGDGSGPRGGDEGFLAVKSSSDTSSPGFGVTFG